MTTDWLGLTDKVFIVTGGSSGIGAAIVDELLADGAYVYNADLKDGEETAEKYTYVQTDVTSAADVNNVVNQAVTSHGHIDGVVNNAGINMPRLLVDAENLQSKYEFTEQSFDKMFSVNVKSVFLMGQAVARELVKQHNGVIVNMSSEAGLEGSIGQSVYSATKAAINGFTRSWGKELGEHNVRVVGVAPGVMEATGLRTPTYEEALAYTRHKTVADIRAGYKSKSTTPLGRSGRLAEVAYLVAYYLSDKAGYITGVTTNVAGGKSRG